MKVETKAALAMGLFLTACLIPSLGMLVLPESPAAANQTLKPPPEWTTPDGSFNQEVLRDTADYLSDHLGLRQEMITLAAILDAKLFHTSAGDSVALGREDWLFYRETLTGYLRTEPMTDRQLYGAARTLALAQEYLQGQGARLYFTAAPNKASLYPQYLGDIGQPLPGEDDIDRLIPFLEAEGVEYIDLFAPFRQSEEILYFRTDSHWNTRGAALAHDTLTGAMGVQDNFFDGPFHDGTPHRGGPLRNALPGGKSHGGGQRL